MSKHVNVVLQFAKRKRSDFRPIFEVCTGDGAIKVLYRTGIEYNIWHGNTEELREHFKEARMVGRIDDPDFWEGTYAVWEIPRLSLVGKDGAKIDLVNLPVAIVEDKVDAKDFMLEIGMRSMYGYSFTVWNSKEQIEFLGEPEKDCSLSKGWGCTEE